MGDPMRKDVLVIGAGVSGLSIAFLLKQRGWSVAVLEKSDRTGGSVATIWKDGFVIDTGPNSTLETSPRIQEMIDMLGLGEEKIYANPVSRNRFILRRAKLNALPMSPLRFLKTPLFSPFAKMRLLAEPFIKPAPAEKEETLAQFVQRRLGEEFLDYAIDPFVSGVYAGVPEKLSVKAAFPKLYALEQKYGSLIKGTIKGAKERKQRAEVSKSEARMFSFKNGMQTLTDRLSEKLQPDVFTMAEVTDISPDGNGVQVSFNRNGEKISVRTGMVVFSIPAYEVAQLIQPFDENLSRKLGSIEYPPVVMTFFGFRDKSHVVHPLDGFGFLVPRKEKRSILGTIFSSSIFINRAPEQGAALTTFIGGMRQPEMGKLEDEYIREMVFNDLDSILGLMKEPDVVEIRKWPRAIPQYQPGHMEIINQIEQFEKKYPLFRMASNFRGGIALGDCIKNAFDHADHIHSILSQ